MNDSPTKHIDEILGDWKDIHKSTHHGFALCYNVSKVDIIEVIEIPSVLEVLSIVLEIERETILLVIVYHMPGPLGSFIEDFTSLISGLPTQHRMLIVGDINLDQMLPRLILLFKIITCLSIHNIQHIHGGILGLVFDLQIPVLLLFCCPL